MSIVGLNSPLSDSPNGFIFVRLVTYPPGGQVAHPKGREAKRAEGSRRSGTPNPSPPICVINVIYG